MLANFNYFSVLMLLIQAFLSHWLRRIIDGDRPSFYLRDIYNVRTCKLCAPTPAADSVIQEAPYNALQETINETPQNSILVICGNVNTKVDKHVGCFGTAGAQIMKEKSRRIFALTTIS